MGKKYKPGDTIIIPEENGNAVKAFGELVDGAYNGMRVLGRALKKDTENLWNAIRGLYPELNDYECSFNAEEMRITIISKKED